MAAEPAAGPSASPVLVEADVLLRGLSRQDPDPLLVQRLGALVAHRRLWLVGWVRQAVLTRAADQQQFQRAMLALAPFPDLGLQAGDHLQATMLSRDLQARGVALAPAQAVLWALAIRISGHIWSRELRWAALRRHGAPLLDEEGVGAADRGGAT